MEKILEDLIDGRCTREQAADWAVRWIRADDPSVEDEGVWEALSALAAADMKTTDRPFLYGELDFREWLDHLKRNR